MSCFSTVIVSNDVFVSLGISSPQATKPSDAPQKVRVAANIQRICFFIIVGSFFIVSLILDFTLKRANIRKESEFTHDSPHILKKNVKICIESVKSNPFSRIVKKIKKKLFDGCDD